MYTQEFLLNIHYAHDQLRVLYTQEFHGLYAWKQFHLAELKFPS